MPLHLADTKDVYQLGERQGSECDDETSRQSPISTIAVKAGGRERGIKKTPRDRQLRRL